MGLRIRAGSVVASLQLGRARRREIAPAQAAQASKAGPAVLGARSTLRRVKAPGCWGDVTAGNGVCAVFDAYARTPVVSRLMDLGGISGGSRGAVRFGAGGGMQLAQERSWII